MPCECKRCGYSSEKKGNVIQHLKATRVCSPVKCNVSRQDLIAELHANKVRHNMKCITCNAEFYHRSQLQKHTCHNEPVAQVALESPQQAQEQRDVIESLTQRVTALETIISNALLLGKNAIAAQGMTRNKPDASSKPVYEEEPSGKEMAKLISD